jgi:hypothetical protein
VRREAGVADRERETAPKVALAGYFNHSTTTAASRGITEESGRRRSGGVRERTPDRRTPHITRGKSESVESGIPHGAREEGWTGAREEMRVEGLEERKHAGGTPEERASNRECTAASEASGESGTHHCRERRGKWVSDGSSGRDSAHTMAQKGEGGRGVEYALGLVDDETGAAQRLHNARRHMVNARR